MRKAESSPNRITVDAKERFFVVVALALAAAYFAWILASRNGDFFLADGYIYLRYAENLASRHEWAFNEGEPSYATSSVTWPILLAALKHLFPGRTGFAQAGALLGLAFYLGSALLTHRLAVRARVETPLRLPLLLLCALWPFAGIVYAMSAMETGLYLLLVSACLLQASSVFVHSTPSNAVRLGILLGLLMLTRVEGLLFALTLALADIIRSPEWWRWLKRWMVVAAPAAVLVGTWWVFALFHFGTALPWSAQARLVGYFPIPGVTINEYLFAGPLERLSFLPRIIRSQFLPHPNTLIHGLLGSAVAGGSGLVALAIPWKPTLPRPQEGAARRAAAAGGLAAGATLALYIFAQPLIFQRYLLAGFPLALLLFGFLGGRFLCRLVPGRWTPSVAVTFALVAAHWVFPAYYGAGTSGSTAWRRLLDGLRTEHPEPVRIAGEQLGLIGYFSSPRSYVIDLGGLITPDLVDDWIRVQGDLPNPCAVCQYREYADTHGAQYMTTVGLTLPPAGWYFLDGPDSEGRAILARSRD